MKFNTAALKILAAWKSWKTRRDLKANGVKLPDLSKLIPLTPIEEINRLKARVNQLEETVEELTNVKNQHEEALSYLFEQVTNLLNKNK